MLTNHNLLIDKNCPMCKAYGNGFVRANLIDKSTVTHYQTVKQTTLDLVDEERAKSEVAFVNKTTGEVVYGIDAFLTILSHERPFLKWVFRQKSIHFLAKKLYRFISFNRYVMSGVGVVNDARNCEPKSHAVYQWMFILLGAFFTGVVVNQFALAVDAKMGWSHSSWREYLIGVGQVGWQFLAITALAKSQRLAYLGNMTAVSVIGGILLLPLLALNHYFELSLVQFLAGFGLIVSYMLIIHLKRATNLQLPVTISISWLLYRMLIVALILYIHL